jgi:hypothetical protein
MLEVCHFVEIVDCQQQKFQLRNHDWVTEESYNLKVPDMSEIFINIFIKN